MQKDKGELFERGQMIAMERWLKLLYLLSEDKFITNQQLSEKLDVSKRTVYSDVAGLNEMLSAHGAEIQTKPHYGVTLVVTDRVEYERFLKSQREDYDSASDNSETRVRIIIQKMIAAKEPVKIDDLCEELFVSRSTLKNDLRKVRSVLEKYDLRMEYSAYKGSWIEGSENSIRKCLTDIGKTMLRDSSKTMSGEMRAISETARQVLTRFHFRMPEYLFDNLVIHLYIATMRIRLGYVVEDAEGYERFTSERDREIATEIIAGMEVLFKLKFPHSELGYIMLHLESKKTSETQDNSVVTAEIYEIVTEMLDEIDNMFHYNFKYDFELISMLAMHLVSLRVRILYNMSMENPLIEEIREGALLAYEMANVVSSKLVNRYGKKVTPDEMAYIALHFHLAIERHKEKHKKNVLIVCGTGRGSAELLAYNVKKEFGSYLNVVGTHQNVNFQTVNFEDVDYILTTVHIEEKVPVPIIEIDSITSLAVRNKVAAHLTFTEKNELLQFFNQELFVAHMHGRDKESVLRQLCDLAKEKRYVSEQFYVHVLQREKIGTTSFGNRIAIPHPYRPEGSRSFVATAILDKPIPWGDDSVQIVFLLSMKAKGDPNLHLFYKSVGKLLTNKEYVNLLIQNPEFENLISILDSLRQE